MNNSEVKGFTLIELLIVIAIVAILAAVVVLTLNPAELLRQARDSNRISDLSTLKSAYSLYLADALTPNLASSTLAYTACYISTPQGTTPAPTSCRIQSAGIDQGILTVGGTPATMVSSSQPNFRKVDSAGWIPVNLNSISSGAPLGNLPVDPVNNSTYFYQYAATTSPVLSFEITAFMESAKFKYLGTGDVVSTDGGRSTSTYEVGTVPGLSL